MQENEFEREPLGSEGVADSDGQEYASVPTPDADASINADVTAPYAETASGESVALESEAGEDDVTVTANGEAENQQRPSFTDTMWHFSPAAPKTAPAPKGSIRRFFILFGAVFGACILLLLLSFIPGELGFKIIKTVETDRVVYVREDDGTSGLLTRQEVAERVGASSVTVRIRTASGGVGLASGFVISADGYIVTNYHAVRDAIVTQVILPDGRAYDATTRGHNADADIAVLKIDASGLVPVTLGRSGDLLVGDGVAAIGTPADLEYEGSATFGSISSTERLVGIFDDAGNMDRKMLLLQTDTAVNPGNSGGPLANMRGEVVGIVVMKVRTYGGSTFEGIGLAIPIDRALPVINAIIENGSFEGENPVSVPRAVIGVSGAGVTVGYYYTVDVVSGKITASELEGDFYATHSGVWVTDVTAAAGKLQKNDIITKVNGIDVRSTAELIAVINLHHVGDTVTLSVVREGSAAVFTVDLVLVADTK